VLTEPGLSAGPGVIVHRGAPSRRCVAALLAVPAAFWLSACTGSAGPTVPTGPASSTVSVSESTGAEPSVASSTEPGSPSGTPAPPLPNPAPSSIPKVTRPDSTGAPSLSAAPAGFATAAAYPDGVVVSIVKASKAIETGQGPGVFAGRELLVVDVQITNGSAAPITLNQVVMTTYYGQAKQLAPGVYPGNVEVKDFSGTVSPAATSSARYAFAVPAAELSVVTMVVDFDASHASAVFTGSVSV
jgi:hypothetical protein